MGKKATSKSLSDKEKKMDDRISKIEAASKQLEKDKTDAFTGGRRKAYGHMSDSMEQKCLAVFGARSPADLLKTNTAQKRFVGVDPVYKSMVASLKESVDVARYIAQIFHGAPKDRMPADEKDYNPSPISHILEHEYGRDVLEPMVKAFGSTVAGEGAEWVPTAISSQFLEEFELEKKVAMMFPEMPMQTNPFELPVQTGITTARLTAEGAQISGANFGTDKIIFNAKKLGEFYPLPEELTEDSAVAILPIARQEVAEAQIRARETAILNGDDSGTHMDFDITAADDAQKLAKGLRKLAIDNSGNGSVVTFSSAVTTAKLDEMRTASGRLGIAVRDLAYLFSPTGYHQAVSLDEVSSVEKFGPQATILNGALAAFRGIPISISEFIREDVSASGVNVNGGPNDKGLVHLVNMKRFWVGMRRAIVVRVMQDLADFDRWLLSSYSRIDFKGRTQDADEVSTVVGIDVTI